MWDWLKAAQAIHALLAILAAIGCVHFAVRSRFWFPRYVHYLGGVALVLGLACLALAPPDAPIHQGGWGWLKQALVVLVFPALVYGFFVCYGGQRGAYERTHQPKAVLCPYCRDAHISPGRQCPNCGQTAD
jgi:uncharacterized membrane protein